MSILLRIIRSLALTFSSQVLAKDFGLSTFDLKLLPILKINRVFIVGYRECYNLISLSEYSNTVSLIKASHY